MSEIENSILSNARILLIDSEESIRNSMTSYFKEITRMFTTIKSAEEALPLLEGPLWDIIVCSFELPGINGLEFLSHVRKLKPGIKLILTTHDSTLSLKKKAAECGAVEIISTLLTPQRLLSSIINVFSQLETEVVPVAEPENSELEKPETVSIIELDESMIITSFVQFGDKYRGINDQTCAWIKHNFKGADAIINREDQEMEVSIEEIQPGDDIKKMHRFPIKLMNLTFVRKQLIKDLKKRGFFAFEVRRKPTEQTLLQKIRQGAIRHTEEFIGKVSDSIDVRDSVSDTIKDLMSDKADDIIDPFDLVRHLDSIVESDTAEAIGVLAALKKGDHLYTHCVDVGAIFLTVYSHWVKANRITSRFKNDAEIMLSAILHDIGKIWLPKEVTESLAVFEVFGSEMGLLRGHPNDSANILSDMNMPEIAINMARYHHVKMDTLLASSYPAVDSYDSVLPETRLFAIVDMFQALVGGRPYKRSWHPSNAMKYINQLAGIECDPEAWTAFREALGWYPVGSLVELNDGSQAFVVEKAYNGLYRPSVVVTRNSYNEELTHNTLIDLNIEKDIFIKKGLDHFEVYGDKSINRFLQLQVS